MYHSNRYRWMCTCFSNFGGPIYTRPRSRIRWQVNNLLILLICCWFVVPLSSGVSVIESRIPMGYPRLMGTEHCWNDFTVPQAHSGGRAKYFPQGKWILNLQLGRWLTCLKDGCWEEVSSVYSSVNLSITNCACQVPPWMRWCMLTAFKWAPFYSTWPFFRFHYGCPEDYDEWARMNSDPGAELWSHKHFNKYVNSIKPSLRCSHLGHQVLLEIREIRCDQEVPVGRPFPARFSWSRRG